MNGVVVGGRENARGVGGPLHVRNGRRVFERAERRLRVSVAVGEGGGGANTSAFDVSMSQIRENLSKEAEAMNFRQGENLAT
jgi:hypothetical protein